MHTCALPSGFCTMCGAKEPGTGTRRAIDRCKTCQNAKGAATKAKSTLKDLATGLNDQATLDWLASAAGEAAKKEDYYTRVASLRERGAAAGSAAGGQADIPGKVVRSCGRDKLVFVGEGGARVRTNSRSSLPLTCLLVQHSYARARTPREHDSP